MKKMQLSALIVVDLQNAFCHEAGSFAKRGYVINDIPRVVDATRQLIDAFDAYMRPILFTKLSYKSDYSDGGLLIERNSSQLKKMHAYINGTWDSEIINNFKIESKERIIQKTRYDPFINTDLELKLTNLGIKHLVLAGIVTNVCVESTARSAFDRGFEITVISDAVSSYDEKTHRNSLENIHRHFGSVVDLKSFLNNEQDYLPEVIGAITETEKKCIAS